MSATDQLAVCDRNIAECKAYAGPDDMGALIGWADWEAEKQMISEGQNATPYASFLARKTRAHQHTGFAPRGFAIDKLFPFQRAIVERALRIGKSCVGADCGLGKTPIQLEWAVQVSERTGKPVLIVAPLAVSHQTREQGDFFGVSVKVVRHQSQVETGVNITNYEMLQHFAAPSFGGVVLDESSIIKHTAGKIRNQVINMFQDTPYRLACSATPAPNDYTELGNHSAFVGAMSMAGMLATYFNHDGGETSKWKLKGHAVKAFWDWVSTWSMFARMPSDVGDYSNDGYQLPPLERIVHVVDTEPQEGFLFPVESLDLGDNRDARKVSVEDRVRLAADLVASEKDRQWIVWGDLNPECEAADDAITDAVEVAGRHTDDWKEKHLLGFSHGSPRVLVTKPKIGGWGMNWQNCDRMVFLGMSHSFESKYQAERRCWRFGQRNTVQVHEIVTDRDAAIVRNIDRKRRQAEEMSQGMMEASRRNWSNG